MAIIIGTDGRDTLVGTSENDSMFGGAGDDKIEGGAGGDTLDGGLGNDWLLGGRGGDTYIVNSVSDRVEEYEDQGIDTVLSYTDYFFLPDYVENMVLMEGANQAIGNELNNKLTGNAGNNYLAGNAGDDTMRGGLGNDIYYVESAGDVVTEAKDEGTDTVYTLVENYTLGANLENVVIDVSSSSTTAFGNALNNIMTGNGLANRLEGKGGDDRLDGRAGADTLVGGAGNDTYVVDNIGDVVTESSSGGVDSVESYIDYTLANNVENLSLFGFALQGTGNSLANTILGNGANNRLDGGGGADVLIGGGGDDQYFVDHAGDIVEESLNAGRDSIYSRVDYTLGANIETLSLIGAEAHTAIGNALDNVLVGNEFANRLEGLDGNDRLDGFWGVDTMIGGLGNDTYVVHEAEDQVVEFAGGGEDVVESWIDYTLGDYFETLSLQGSARVGQGNALNNGISGNNENNLLLGGAGYDIIFGGYGDDEIYGGADGDYINGAMDDDVLYGEGGNDTLIGGYGDDLLYGGDGNDELYMWEDVPSVDRAWGGAGNDILHLISSVGATTMGESAAWGGEGVDTLIADYRGGPAVSSGYSPTLNALVINGIAIYEFEVIQIYGSTFDDYLGGGLGNDYINAGSGSDWLLGNNGVDTLEGGQGDDRLDGGSGSDLMIGGLGDDLYIKNVSGDRVVEDENGGIDMMFTTAYSTTLDDNIEILELLENATRAKGNSSDNRIAGNGRDNILDGAAGADTLLGLGGSDTLTGGSGADHFAFTGAGPGSMALITDFELGVDKIALSSRWYNLEPLPVDSDHIDFDYLDLDGNGSAESTLIRIDNNGGGDSYYNLATLQNVLMTDFSDFTVLQPL